MAGALQTMQIGCAASSEPPARHIPDIPGCQLQEAHVRLRNVRAQLSECLSSGVKREKQ